MGVKGA